VTGPQQPEDLIRLDAFRQRHPGIVIGEEFGTWHAGAPAAWSLGRPTLTGLLDALEQYFADEPDTG
jgi:hypothetical protein